MVPDILWPLSIRECENALLALIDHITRKSLKTADPPLPLIIKSISGFTIILVGNGESGKVPKSTGPSGCERDVWPLSFCDSSYLSLSPARTSKTTDIHLRYEHGTIVPSNRMSPDPRVRLSFPLQTPINSEPGIREA